VFPVRYELDMYVFEACKVGTLAIKLMPVTSAVFKEFLVWGPVLTV
jgi:hypothetical protein